MPALGISAAKLGVAISAYAISARISGVLAVGFARRFDCKHLRRNDLAPAPCRLPFA
jgi:predicted MFS family arabinose efflux permease